MKRRIRILMGCVCLALGWSQAGSVQAQWRPNWNASKSSEPVIIMSSAPVGQPVSYMQAPATGQAPSTPQAPARPTPDQLAQAPSAFTEAAPAGTEGPGSYAPQMLGDSVVYFTIGNFAPPGVTSSSSFGQSGLQEFVAVANLAGSAFKIADNEGIRPEDRVFLNVNYFTGLFHSVQPLTFPERRLRLTREVFGFEKTCLDGNASLGMRIPFFQMHGSDGSSFSDIGNITLISKAILTGSDDGTSLFVGGFALTLPTGPNVPISVTTLSPIGGVPITTQVDSINPTILQPYLGFLSMPNEDMYIHGFSSLAISTDDSVPTVWFNDIAVGYWAYRGSSASIVPTVEAHLTTPFGKQGVRSFPIGVPHTLVTTLAAHIIGNNNGMRFTFGWGFPLTGPQPFSNELIAQVNMPF